MHGRSCVQGSEWLVPQVGTAAHLGWWGPVHGQPRIKVLPVPYPLSHYYYYYYYYYTIWMSLVTGFFFPVLLLNQRWSPPLRLQASHCSTFRIMCDVPSIAVFCSEFIECFHGTTSKFFLKHYYYYYNKDRYIMNRLVLLMHTHGAFYGVGY